MVKFGVKTLTTKKKKNSLPLGMQRAERVWGELVVLSATTHPFKKKEH